MKKFLLVCSLLGAISIVHAQPAQPAMPDHPMAARMMMHEHNFDPAEHAAHLQKTLQLSDEQTAKVKKLFESDAQQRKALMDKYKPQFDAFHSDMKNLHDQTHKQLSTLLTPKQQEALEAQHKSHGGEMCGNEKDSDAGEHHHEHSDKVDKK